MKPITILLFILFITGKASAQANINGTWLGAIVGHVDNRDYFIKADLKGKRNSNYTMKMKLYSDDYSGEFLLQLNQDGDKFNIQKVTKVSEFPIPYLHIEDCFTGYFLLKDESNHLRMDLYRNPVYHKIEEFTNIDGDGNFVTGFECFTSLLLRSTVTDTVNISSAQRVDSLISSKKNRSDQASKRKVVSSKVWKVKSNKITLEVWDNNKVDGDIISLKMNNAWILTNFLLAKEKHIIQVDLKKKENELMLFAENLGSIPPNTASVTINDGIQPPRTFILNSDMLKSEVIKIILDDDVNAGK